MSAMRGWTIGGLVVGAIGIGILWAAGVEFPFYPPPGLLILAAGAAFVAFAPWRWAPGVGVALGVFMIVGFVASGTGTDNLLGEHGTGVAVGQVVQLVGVITALVAGVIATRQAYRQPVSR